MLNKKLYYAICKQKFYKQKLYIDLFLDRSNLSYSYGLFLNKKITIYKNLLMSFYSNSICLQNE